MRDLLIRDGVSIEVLIDSPQGEADAPAGSIVLLPSSQRDSLDFDRFATRLCASGFKVIRPQPRGMGRSVGPMEGLDLNVLARDVAHVIDRHADGRALVAGHAFGHYIARVAALNHAANVRGVVLMAAASRDLPRHLSEALDVAADAQRDEAERLAGLRLAFFAPGNDPRPWLDGWYPALREVYRQAGRTPDKDVWWPVSPVPLLDLQAALDPWRPPVSRRELADVLGDRVTVVQIEGASHALPFERPDETAAAIASWALTLPR